MNKLKSDQQIKNIIFDIGNVVVKWSPDTIVAQTFAGAHDHAILVQRIFKHNFWLQLNRGELTEAAAKIRYQDHLNVSADKIDLLFETIKSSQSLIVGTVDLLKKLYNPRYKLYALTNNVKEIIDFLKLKYDFWHYFSGIVVSADVGCLKPHPEIFQHIVDLYQLKLHETVFIDDYHANVAGAQAHGIYGIQFFNAKQCESALQHIGVVL